MVLTEDYIQDVIKAAPMHDIGKIATPDSILQKPGKLTDEEYTVIKQHTRLGYDLLRKNNIDMFLFHRNNNIFPTVLLI